LKKRKICYYYKNGIKLKRNGNLVLRCPLKMLKLESFVEKTYPKMGIKKIKKA
jgi:hypothetical protein